MSIEDSGTGEHLPATELQLEQIGNFIDDRLRLAVPEHVATSARGRLELRELSITLPSGIEIICESTLTVSRPDMAAGDERIIATIRPDHDKAQNQLTLYGDHTVSAGAVVDRQVMLGLTRVTQAEALARAGFRELVSDVHAVISGDVLQPEINPLLGLLPNSAVIAVESPLPAAERLVAEVGWINQPLNKDEDTAVIDEAHNVYAVLDGLGGVKGSRVAARLSAAVVQSHMEQVDRADAATPDEACVRIVAALQAAHQTILSWNQQPELGPAGATTATVAQVVAADGDKYVAWASVGDSPLSMVTPEGRFMRISQDEVRISHDNDGELQAGLTNVLGIINRFDGASQHGVFRVEDGTILMLATDGITGNPGSTELSDREMLHAVNLGLSAQGIADQLLYSSRKPDDKTAIAIRI